MAQIGYMGSWGRITGVQPGHHFNNNYKKKKKIFVFNVVMGLLKYFSTSLRVRVERDSERKMNPKTQVQISQKRVTQKISTEACKP